MLLAEGFVPLNKTGAMQSHATWAGSQMNYLLSRAERHGGRRSETRG